MPQKAICSVCRVQKTIGPNGLMKLHTRHGKTCDGSALPPHERKAPTSHGWAAVRRATFERDGHRCRKCSSGTGLEAHHRKERVNGGLDELDNLITLCSLCHDEWTYLEPPAHLLSFDAWLTVPPAQVLAIVFAKPWPEDVSAAEYQRAIATMARILAGGP